ncbi:MAG: hypothetical protein LBN41_00480 [Enterobacteriaceae bacterium]|jgi:hypothetical protein|nr:hypothetical protein [Enterobacteriaceae bacterium]
MKMIGNFSALEHLIQIYFGQDYYEITGATTVSGVMAFYLKDNPLSQIDLLITDITEFESIYANTLDNEFSSHWGNDFSPVRWGTTTKDFLKKIRLLAIEHQALTR